MQRKLQWALVRETTVFVIISPLNRIFLVQCANQENAGIGFIIYLSVYLVFMYVKMYGQFV